MAKIGRNDPCPCGSSKKYKQCCLAKDEAAARAAAPPPPAPTPRRAGRVVFPQDDDDVDLLTEASNAVIALIRAGDIDAAEQAAHQLLERYPEVHDGFDRLGMVCEAKGENGKAADYYRRAMAFIQEHGDDDDGGPNELVATYQRLIDRLDPPQVPAG